MPILDARVLDDARGDAEALRDILGPVSHGPLHAEKMRESAQRMECSIEGASRREVGDAIRRSERAGRVALHRLHSSA
jgi:hypothetical protein